MVQQTVTPPSQKPTARQECMTLSDWIMFLTSEKAINSGQIMGMLAVIFAYYAIVIALAALAANPENLVPFVAITQGVGAGALFIFFFVTRRKHEAINSILAKIMFGRLTSSDAVLKEWVKEVNKYAPKPK